MRFDHSAHAHHVICDRALSYLPAPVCESVRKIESVTALALRVVIGGRIQLFPRQIQPLPLILLLQRGEYLGAGPLPAALLPYRKVEQVRHVVQRDDVG